MRAWIFAAVTGLLFSACFAQAELWLETHVAVVANFVAPANEIAALFKEKTGP